MAQITWGTGLRKIDILRLCVKDIDFERRELTIRQGEDGKKTRLRVAWIVSPLVSDF